MKPLFPWACALALVAGLAPAIGEEPGAGSRGTEAAEASTYEERLESGRRAFLRGRFAEAKEVFAAFLEGYGENAQVAEAVAAVRPLFALCLVRTGDYAAARPALDVALAQPGLEKPLREELAFARGVAAMQLADWGAAQVAFGEFYQERGYQGWRRDEALVLFGTCQMRAGAHAEAAAFFASQQEKLRGRNPVAAGRAALLELQARVSAGDQTGALALVKEAFPRMGEMEELVAFQNIVVRLGAGFFDQGNYYEAVSCLQRVWPRERLLRHQKEKVGALADRVTALEERRAGQGTLAPARASLARAEAAVVALEGQGSFDAAVRLRLARAFAELTRFREAALVLEGMIREMPGDAVVEQAAVALVESWMQVGRWQRAIAAGRDYGERFVGTGLEKGWDKVRFLVAESYERDFMLDDALAGYTALADSAGDAGLAARASFMRGIVQLGLDANGEAVRSLQVFRATYPQHPLVEDAVYWEAMGRSFEKNHAEAFAAAGRYLEKYPGGKYAAEAEFRQAFSRHAEARYGDAIPLFEAFIERHPGTKHVDEARLLLGDALLAGGEIDPGLASYAAISPQSTRFYEDGYFKAGKALLLTGRTDEMREHFHRFIRDYPSSGKVAEAVYQLGKLSLKSGDPGGAREAYWDAIRNLGDNPDAGGVEDILLALPRTYKATDNPTVALTRDLDELIAGTENARPVLHVRALWAKGRVLEERNTALANIALLQAGSLADPKRDSPRILVDCAGARLASGNPKTAATLYREARRWHPRTPEKDRIYFGLARAAEAANDAPGAAGHYRKCAEETFRPPLRGEALLALAGLQAEKTPGLARATLDELLGDKSVPAGHKAEALTRYAEILADGGDPKKALAYFERVYVAYGKYRELVAHAYFRRGTLLESLGMPDEARAVFGELVAREDLAGLPEIWPAKERLAALGGGAG